MRIKNLILFSDRQLVANRKYVKNKKIKINWIEIGENAVNFMLIIKVFVLNKGLGWLSTQLSGEIKIYDVLIKL